MKRIDARTHIFFSEVEQERRPPPSQFLFDIEKVEKRGLYIVLVKCKHGIVINVCVKGNILIFNLTCEHRKKSFLSPNKKEATLTLNIFFLQEEKKEKHMHTLLKYCAKLMLNHACGMITIIVT